MSWRRKILGFFGIKPSWQEVEFFDQRWRQRIEAMSRHIGPNESVLDLGCGHMWLKEFLQAGNTYHPCDYVSRGAGTILCDFNAKQFPQIIADVCFISGCLEYVEDYEWFVKQVANACSKCVIAYCIVTPKSSLKKRQQNAWKNHLTEGQLKDLFHRNGMEYTDYGGQFMSSHLYVFRKGAAVR